MIENWGGEHERVMIVDFGAAAVSEGLAGSQSALLLGSFDYMAPERVAGRSSSATDVYALAAVAFELLTGVRYRSLADGPEAGLKRALPGFSDEIARLLGAGVAYAPEDRPQDINEFARQLAEAISLWP